MAISEEAFLFDGIYVLLSTWFVFAATAGLSVLTSVRGVTFNSRREVWTKVQISLAAGVLTWYVFGYALAYGGGEADWWMGLEPVLFIDHDACTVEAPQPCFPARRSEQQSLAVWLHQWATGQAMVSIAVFSVISELSVVACTVNSVVAMGVVYALGVHWVWSAFGWISPFLDTDSWSNLYSGAMDYGGAGVVALTGAIMATSLQALLAFPLALESRAAARRGRAEPAEPDRPEEAGRDGDADSAPVAEGLRVEDSAYTSGPTPARHSRLSDSDGEAGGDAPDAAGSILQHPLYSLGVLLLVLGWVNLASSQQLGATQGRLELAMRTAVNLLLGGTVGSGAALLAVMLITRLQPRLQRSFPRPPAAYSFMGLLGGLVAVSASGPTPEYYGAIAIGASTALPVLLWLGVFDRAMPARARSDPCSVMTAFAPAGLWGLLLAGLFATGDRTRQVYGEQMNHGAIYGGKGKLILTNFVAALALTALALAAVLLFNLPLLLLGFFRSADDAARLSRRRKPDRPPIEMRSANGGGNSNDIVLGPMATPSSAPGEPGPGVAAPTVGPVQAPPPPEPAGFPLPTTQGAFA